MIEKTVLDFLSGRLDVPCYMEVPEEPPQTFCLLEKTGSGVKNRVFSAVFAVQSYGESLYEAARLNERVKEVMGELEALPDIGRVRLNTDYPFNDLGGKRSRYQAVFDITHY